MNAVAKTPILKDFYYTYIYLHTLINVYPEFVCNFLAGPSRYHTLHCTDST